MEGTPLLASEANPGGWPLLDLLEQLHGELVARQTLDPSREGACVLTKTEEALMWERRRTEQVAAAEGFVGA